MQFNGKECKVYEVFSLFSQEKNDENLKKDELLEKEFITQDINFSRIAFKDYRDELVRCHLGYADESHDGKVGEDDLAKDMYQIDRLGYTGKFDYSIGRVVDYQIPIKRCNEDCKCDMEIANIDLLCETATNLYLINIVEKESEESLLRSVLEIITYRNMISRTKLISDYSVSEKNILKYYHTKDDMVPTVMFYENSRAHEDMKNLNPESLLGRLVGSYKIKFFVLKNLEKGNYELID